MNCITEIAKKHGRDYITPEDVTEALEENSPAMVKQDTLEVLAEVAGQFGVEDRSLCAYNAWECGEV